MSTKQIKNYRPLLSERSANRVVELLFVNLCFMPTIEELLYLYYYIKPSNSIRGSWSLFASARHGFTGIVLELVSEFVYGPDLFHALQCAVNHGHVDSARILLPRIVIHELDKGWLLEYAMESVAMFQLFMDNGGFSVSDASIRTPIRNDNDDVLKLILTYGTDITRNRFSCIEYAVTRKSVKCLLLLLKDPQTVDMKFHLRAAISFACENNEQELVRYMVDDPRFVVPHLRRGLNVACEAGHISIVRMLLDKCDCQTIGALSFAIGTNNVKLVRVLVIDYGFHVNQQHYNSSKSQAVSDILLRCLQSE